MFIMAGDHTQLCILFISNISSSNEARLQSLSELSSLNKQTASLPEFPFQQHTIQLPVICEYSRLAIVVPLKRPPLRNNRPLSHGSHLGSRNLVTIIFIDDYRILHCSPLHKFKILKFNSSFTDCYN